MESGRHHSGGRPGADRGGQIGMTLQADLLHHWPRQHPWIGRTVRFMASGTAFKADRCVFKGERTALVSMALEAAWLIGRETLRHCGPYASVRVVAIDAGHCAFHHPVMKRFLKLRRDGSVADGALLVDRRRLARNHTQGAVSVHFVARGAGDLVLGMAVLQTPHMRRLAEVASQANLVGGAGRERPGIANIPG
jgi:hypothetical protein